MSRLWDWVDDLDDTQVLALALLVILGGFVVAGSLILVAL